MTTPDPNADATAESVADSISGTDGNGVPLAFDQVAMLYAAHILGLSKDYAFAEGSNTSPSEIDHVTTLAKVLTRTHLHVDGNTYDIWDAVQTILKSVLLTNPTINDDEVDSVNYKAPTPTPTPTVTPPATA
jgi:hypothetical protein